MISILLVFLQATELYYGEMQQKTEGKKKAKLEFSLKVLIG